MRNRNYYLVDHSSILLAVYNGSHRSGTGMTVRYAKKLGREIFSIDPITRKSPQLFPCAAVIEAFVP